MLGKIRKAAVLGLFPAIVLAAFLWRPAFVDDVGLRQLAVLGAGYALALAVYGVFAFRPNAEMREIARAYRRAERGFSRERAELQTRLDFLAAEREISLVLNQDVEFETILDKVLSITHHALGGQPEDEIEIYLRDEGSSRLILRAARRQEKTKFVRRGRESGDAQVADCLEQARLLFSSQNGRLDVAAPLSSDGDLVGVVRVRTLLDGDPTFKSERADMVLRNLEEFSHFIALAVKTPNLYTRAVEDGLTGLATKRHFFSMLDADMAT
ncbi:MAG: hypothetical protein ACYTDY_17565, partial [Planctomycetota bacterium]